jgi:hypothetical protein
MTRRKSKLTPDEALRQLQRSMPLKYHVPQTILDAVRDVLAEEGRKREVEDNLRLLYNAGYMSREEVIREEALIMKQVNSRNRVRTKKIKILGELVVKWALAEGLV